MALSWISRLTVVLAVSQFYSPVVAQVESLLSSINGEASASASATASSTPILQSITSSAATSSASATPSSSGEPAVHLIKAGAGGFKFTPQQLTNVSIGDIVTFEFYPPDHSVVQAEYGSACVPYSYADREHAGKGFWTETQWVDTAADITHYNITINDTAPIFFYCAAPNSCIGELMVGAINPNDTQTLNGQIQAARDADFQLTVGQPVPKEATSTILNGPTATSEPTSGGGGGGSKLSGGAIAGIVVGAVAFLVICAALFFYVGRSKSLKEVIKRQDATVRNSTPGPDMHGLPSPGMHPHGSPTPGYVEAGSLPPYAQHNATDQYPSGWTSPNLNQGHMSMMSQTSGMSQEQLDYYKQAQGNVQPAPVELHSPTPGQPEFRAELEDNVQKPPRT